MIAALYVQTDPDLADMFSGQDDYIRSETLAKELHLGTPPEGAVVASFTLADVPVTVGLVRQV